MLGKRTRQAGVARLFLHDLRRTFGGDLLDLISDRYVLISDAIPTRCGLGSALKGAEMETSRHTTGIIALAKGVALGLRRPLALLIAVLLGLSGCGGSPAPAASGGTGGSNAIPTAPIPVTSVPIPSNLSAGDDKALVAIKKAELADRLPASGADTGTLAGSVWLLVTVQLTNKSTKPMSIGPLNGAWLFGLDWADVRLDFEGLQNSIRPAVNDAVLNYPQVFGRQLGETPTSDYKDLSPGKSVTGVVIFAVKQDYIRRGLILRYLDALCTLMYLDTNPLPSRLQSQRQAAGCTSSQAAVATIPGAVPGRRPAVRSQDGASRAGEPKT